MSTQFSYAQYQNVVEQAQANSNGDGTKIGYFKLKDDGDIAIARINLGSTDEFSFAAVHTISTGGKWIKVSCLNPLGMNAGGCPLCAANAANPKGSVGKAAKKMYIPMLVSYRDSSATTGYTPPIPVIWDRPASFSRELANKLMIAGDLRNTLVLITRNGKAGDMQTTYSVDILPETHPVFKPEMIPTDFSAFNNFEISRHSYWVKTAEEMNAFITTGQFPERAQVNTQPANTNVAAAYNVPQTGGYVAPTPTTQVAPGSTQSSPAAFNPGANTNTFGGSETPVSNSGPARNFTGFSF